MKDLLKKMLDGLVARKGIAIRFLYTVLFLIVFEILKLIVQITILIQFIFLAITKNHNESLRRFSNKISTYAYKVLRYMSLNDNQKPYPLTEFPEEIDPPVDRVDI